MYQDNFERALESNLEGLKELDSARLGALQDRISKKGFLLFIEVYEIKKK